MCRCTLPAGTTCRPVYHRTVEEIWYILNGQGQVWRKQGDQEQVVDVHPGICLPMPTGVHFEFRTASLVPPEFIIVTLPPWPEETRPSIWTKAIGPL